MSLARSPGLWRRVSDAAAGTRCWASQLRHRAAAAPAQGRAAACPALPGPELGAWLARSAPGGTAPAFGLALPHRCGIARQSQLARPLGGQRLASSQTAADPDAAGSFSAMSVVAQRIDGVRWRVFGAVPDHAGTRGTKKLRKKLAGPSVLSWCARSRCAGARRRLHRSSRSYTVLHAGTRRPLKSCTRPSTERKASCGASDESAWLETLRSRLPIQAGWHVARTCPASRPAPDLLNVRSLGCCGDYHLQAASRGEGQVPDAQRPRKARFAQEEKMIDS
jgi:hypothetical protein